MLSPFHRTVLITGKVFHDIEGYRWKISPLIGILKATTVKLIHKLDYP
jgi:hypothetical protein